MEKQRRRELAEQYKQRKITGGVYAYKNTKDGKLLVLSTTDLAGSKNLFAFSQATGSCVHPKLQNVWQPGLFAFEVLEELEKKPEQTDAEFAADIKALEELWLEKLPPESRY